MAKLLNACAGDAGMENTGVECDKMLAVLLGLMAVPATAKWSKADMADPLAFFQEKIHAPKAERFYPIFADLKNFEVADGSDQQETYGDGTTKLLRLGGYTMTLSFIRGGECLAKKLLSLNKKGYRVIVFDELDQFKVRKNADGTYSGLKVTDLYGSRPQLATYAASFQNKVVINISTEEYIKHASIFKSDTELSDLTGLLDVDVESKAAAIATKVTVGASTECAGTDLYDLYPDDLAVPDAWKVMDSTGAAVTVTTVAKNAAVKGWDLTFATQAGKTLSVGLADASVLAGLDPAVTGYEGAGAATIVIPSA